MRLCYPTSFLSLRRWARAVVLMWPALVLLLTANCTLSIPLTLAPAVTPTDTPSADGWTTLAPGLERRVYQPNPANALSQLTVVRVDPALYTFRAHYRPANALGLTAWRQALPDAVAFINANFFDPQDVAIGMVVNDGVVSGQTLVGRGGMLQVAGGQPRVRSLIAEPYAGEPLEQAVQAFPMLVLNGQASYNNVQDRDVSRRSVVAQDASGRILLMATSVLGITLADLSAFLAASDMQIVNALNLDGGGSTMLFVGPGSTPLQQPSFDPVPVVLAVHPR